MSKQDVIDIRILKYLIEYAIDTEMTYLNKLP